MISEALNFIRSHLDDGLRRSFGAEREWLKLSPLVTPDGTQLAESHNAVLMTLVKLGQEGTVRNRRLQQHAGASNLELRPPLELNLHVLFSAALPDYSTSLMLLSEVIGRLQNQPVMDSSSSPEFPSELARLSFAMESLDYSQQSQLWGGLGVKYVPSALYWVRLVSLGGGVITGRSSGVTHVQTQAET